MGVKTEEKERVQGSTGAIRGGGNLHIDLQKDRSMDGFFPLLHCASRNLFLFARCRLTLSKRENMPIG